jgi:hypothetical protein
MFLILFFLLCSLVRHFSDIRPEEALLLTALGATIIFAIVAAWRVTHSGG